MRVIGFKTTYSGKKAVDWVEIAPSGASFDKCRTWHMVDRMRPTEVVDEDPDRRAADTHMAMSARWSVIGPAYQAYKAGMDIPENGTPLAAWAGISADQARHLVSLGIRTVEDVRDMDEGIFPRIPFPNVRQLPGLARAYLEGRDKAEADTEIATLRERQAALEERLATLSAVEAEADKPRRGRPPKAKDEEAA
jgi:hypothetical protein